MVASAVVMRLRGRAPDLAVLALFLLLALFVTGGMLVHPSHELAHNDSDSGLLSWFLAHDAHALANGGRELFVTDDINAPAGINLMWNTALLLPGVLLAPLTWVTSARTTYAVLLWLAPALSAFAAYATLGAKLRGRALIQGRTPRIIAGLLFGFSPALVAQSLGHLQMTLLLFVPVILFLVVEAAVGDRAPLSVGVLAGAVAAAQLLTGEEVLFVTAFLGVLLLVGIVASRPGEITRSRVTRFTAVTTIALVTFLAIAAIPLLVQFLGAHKVHGTPFTRDYYKLDVTAFTTPTKLQLLAPADATRVSDGYRGGPEEHTGYLGLPLIVFAAVMLVLRWRDLRVRVPIVISIVLSVLALGLHPLVRSVPHDSVTLPWRAFIDLPFFESMLVSRLPLMTALLLAVAMAATLESMAAPTFAVSAIGALVLLPLVPQPIDTSPRPKVPTFFSEGARQIAQGSTVVIAPPAGYGHVDAMRWQVASGFRFRLVGGYFIGPSYDGRAIIGPLPRTLPTLLDQVRETGQLDPLTPEQRASVAIDLEFYDASAVIVGPMPHQAEAVALVSDILGRPPELVGGVSLWRL